MASVNSEHEIILKDLLQRFFILANKIFYCSFLSWNLILFPIQELYKNFFLVLLKLYFSKFKNGGRSCLRAPDAKKSYWFEKLCVKKRPNLFRLNILVIRNLLGLCIINRRRRRSLSSSAVCIRRHQEWETRVRKVWKKFWICQAGLKWYILQTNT